MGEAQRHEPGDKMRLIANATPRCVQACGDSAARRSRRLAEIRPEEVDLETVQALLRHGTEPVPRTCGKNRAPAPNP